MAGVCTVDRGEGPIGMAVYHDDMFALGPSLADWAADSGGPVTLGHHPRRGAHIDVPARTVGIWTEDDYGGIARSWADIWPGWTLDLWEDRAAEQVRRARGALALPAADLAGVWVDYGRNLDQRWLECTREWWAKTCASGPSGSGGTRSSWPSGKRASPASPRGWPVDPTARRGPTRTSLRT